jgi:hypothetical protein
MTRLRVVVVDCPRCEAKVNAEVIATEMVGDADIQMPSHRISFVRCPGCHQTLLTREEFEGQSNSWGEDEYVFGSPSRLWPTPIVRPTAPCHRSSKCLLMKRIDAIVRAHTRLAP